MYHRVPNAISLWSSLVICLLQFTSHYIVNGVGFSSIFVFLYVSAVSDSDRHVSAMYSFREALQWPGSSTYIQISFCGEKVSLWL